MAEFDQTKHGEIAGTKRALNTCNPLRTLVDRMVIEPNKDKSLIPLSYGDPTVFGNMPVSDATKEALYDVIREGKCHGYGICDGFAKAREAVAKFYQVPQHPITAHDVILTPSCNSALDFAIAAIAEEGSNILIPRPGFCIYSTLCTLFNVNVKYYNLVPESQWEIDLNHLQSVIDEKTSAIVVCNPSNPCGSVWNLNHIKDIIGVAEKHGLPIIADEVYGGMVYSGTEFHSFGKVSQNVPVLVASGLSKRWLVPGWRMGWVLIYDRHNLFKNVRQGLLNLTTRYNGPNSICQLAIPKILANTPPEFYRNVMDKIERNSRYVFSSLSKVPGLCPIMPSGAMYLMVKMEIDFFPPNFNDQVFAEQLVREQSVICLPGTIFQYPNSVRIVLVAPFEMIQEACTRIDQFCCQFSK